MLAVGIDWSEEFHLVALGRPGEGVFDIRRVEHSPKAVDALVDELEAPLERIEDRSGHLVDDVDTRPHRTHHHPHARDVPRG